MYEDHEMLVDNLMLWTRESKNKILFAERPEKIALFQSPEKFLLSEDDRGNNALASLIRWSLTSHYSNSLWYMFILCVPS